MSYIDASLIHITFTHINQIQDMHIMCIWRSSPWNMAHLVNSVWSFTNKEWWLSRLPTSMPKLGVGYPTYPSGIKRVSWQSTKNPYKSSIHAVWLRHHHLHRFSWWICTENPMAIDGVMTTRLRVRHGAFQVRAHHGHLVAGRWSNGASTNT